MRKYSILKPMYSILFVIACCALCSGQAKMELEQTFVRSLCDNGGNLWFVTNNNGVYRYDAVTGVRTILTEREGLCANNVYGISEDKAGNLWFGTEKGVCRYDGTSFTNVTIKEGLWNFAVNYILEDRSGNFWFGTNGYGVYRYDPSAEMASMKYLTHFTTKNGLGSDAVQCILEDRAGNIWFGERAGGVSRYDSASGSVAKVKGTCFSSQIMSIIEDETGNIWFANLYDGLCRYDPVTSGFTHFTEKDGVCHNHVTCVYEDREGDLWFGSDAGKWGTDGGGLCRYDGKSFTRFTSKDGLANMNVLTIVEDNGGNIWVGAKGGLYRYHSPSGKFVDYTYKLNR